MLVSHAYQSLVRVASLTSPIRFLLLSFSVLLALVGKYSLPSRGHHQIPASSSAAWEFGVGEDSASVEGIRVLWDVGYFDVVLGLAQSFHDLGVDVVLCATGRGHVEVSPLAFVAVLLARPHKRLLLGGHFENGGVQRLNDRVANLGILIDDWLGRGRHLVVKAIACLECATLGSGLLHDCIPHEKTHIQSIIYEKRCNACLPGCAADFYITNCCLIIVLWSAGRFLSCSARYSAMSASVQAKNYSAALLTWALSYWVWRDKKGGKLIRIRKVTNRGLCRLTFWKPLE